MRIVLSNIYFLIMQEENIETDDQVKSEIVAGNMKH